MKGDYITRVLQEIKKDLREGEHVESRYQTAKESNLRAEVIKRLECLDYQGNINGSAAALNDYVESYIRRFPERAMQIIREAYFWEFRSFDRI